MKTVCYRFFSFQCLVIFLNLLSCESDNTKPKLAITAFTPEKGVAGTSVTITGSNFSPIASENQIMFGNTAAIVSSASSTQLVTTVPAGAITGKITVTTDNRTATSIKDFIVVLPPTVNTFTPTHGLPGTLVTISGTNFSTTLGDDAVTINDIAASIISATPTSIVISVPDGAATGKISITVDGAKTVTVDDFEVLKDIPRTGLVAFYPLDGNGDDVSGNALNGSLNGTTNGGPTAGTNRFGSAGKSLQFDGVDDFVKMGDPIMLQVNNTITVAGWVNIHAYKTAANKMQTIITDIYFDPSQGGNPTRGFNIAQDFTGAAVPTFYANCYSTAGLSLSNFVGDTVDTGSWIFFALVIDGKSCRFYQNNILTFETTVTQSVNILDEGSIGDLTLGTYGGGFFFDGSIDDITIYNRALTSTEITKVYEQTVSKY
jgi:hypothetical protein